MVSPVFLGNDGPEEEAAVVKSHGKQIKDDRLYDALRNQGASKEKAARIANAKADASSPDPSRRGGRHPRYEEWRKDALYDKARQIGIDGRSTMTKSDLIDALRAH